MEKFNQKDITCLKNCIIEPISDKEYWIYKKRWRWVYEMIWYCSKKHIKDLIKLKNQILYKDFKHKI